MVTSIDMFRASGVRLSSIPSRLVRRCHKFCKAKVAVMPVP